MQYKSLAFVVALITVLPYTSSYADDVETDIVPIQEWNTAQIKSLIGDMTNNLEVSVRFSVRDECRKDTSIDRRKCDRISGVDRYLPAADEKVSAR